MEKGEAIALSKCIHLIDEVHIANSNVTKEEVNLLANALVKSNHKVGCKIEFVSKAFG